MEREMNAPVWEGCSEISFIVKVQFIYILTFRRSFITFYFVCTAGTDSCTFSFIVNVVLNSLFIPLKPFLQN